jgi:hypothetical protein
MAEERKHAILFAATLLERSSIVTDAKFQWLILEY